MKEIYEKQMNETSGMQELTLEEMKNLNGGADCVEDYWGCVNDVCCIGVTCIWGAVAYECGDYDWYLYQT